MFYILDTTQQNTIQLEQSAPKGLARTYREIAIFCNNIVDVSFIICLLSILFYVFLVYGSWEPLDSLKILSRGVGTFSTPGKAIPRILKNQHFCVFFPRNPIFVVAPISSALDLAIFSICKFWDPSRLRRNAL